MYLDVSRSNADPEKPIRVLLVAPALTILGGQAVQANYLLEHLSREPGFEVSFVPHNPRLPGPFKLLQSIKYVRTLVTSFVYCINLLLQVPRHDIVHTFSASYLSFLLAPTPAILIARLFGKKVILNYRSGEAEDHLRSWPRTAVPIMRLADELIVPSQYFVDVFAKFGLRAIGGSQHHRSRVASSFNERKPLLPIFLSNRNLYPLYNVGCILRAFAKIQQRFPEAQLIIAGDGSQRPSLESLARELKLQNVEFRGRVAPHNMHELYDEAHIFLNSSNIDNMPGSILESFASGMPVVSTSAGGIQLHRHSRKDRTAGAEERSRSDGLRGPSACSSRRSLRRQSRAMHTRSVRLTRGKPCVTSWRAAYMRLAGSRECRSDGSSVVGRSR